MNTTHPVPLAAPVPVLALLDPGRHRRRLLGALALGVALAALPRFSGVPLQLAAGGALALLLAALAPKWAEDGRRHGATGGLLSAAIAIQGLHAAEYGAQWFQHHVLRWHLLDSNGLLSGASPDALHFAWGLAVLLLCAAAAARGARGPRMWLLLLVAGAHMIDYSYTLVRYLQISAELQALGAAPVASPYLTLPGLLGRDGWLATAELTRGTPLGRLPGIASAPRMDVQLWWCLAELALLLAATNSWLTARRGRNP